MQYVLVAKEFLKVPGTIDTCSEWAGISQLKTLTTRMTTIYRCYYSLL